MCSFFLLSFIPGGVSTALGKVVGVLAKTTTKLTMDEEFQEKRKRAGAGGVRQGLEGAAKVRRCSQLHINCHEIQSVFTYNNFLNTHSRECWQE